MNDKQMKVIQLMLMNLVRIERKALYSSISNKKQLIQKTIDDGFVNYLGRKDDNL